MPTVRPSLLRRPLPAPTARRVVAAGRRADATEPRALRARYEQVTDRIIIDFRGGYAVAIPRRTLRGVLRRASVPALRRIRVEGGGSVLYWPMLDDGFDVTEVLTAAFGMRAAAAALGSRGGAARSPAKTAAARANGRQGGRPSGLAGRGPASRTSVSTAR
jgi:hypothetical protein